MRKFLDNYIGQKVPFTFQPGETNKNSGGKLPSIGKTAFWSRLLKIHFTAQKHVDKFERTFFQKREEWRKSPYNELSLDALLDHLHDLFTGFVDKHYYSQGIADILVMVFPGMLSQLTGKWFDRESDEDRDAISIKLLQGVDVKSTGPSELIARMAEKISRSPSLSELLKAKQYSVLESSLLPEQEKLLTDFMHYFGGRCYNECMIVSPTFEERHDLFWDLVNKYSRAGKKQHSEEETKKQQAEYVSGLLKKLPLFRRIVFRRALHEAHRAIRLREQGRIIRSLLFGEIRHIVLEIGSRLIEKGHLKQREDVFYLHHREIEDLSYGKYQFPELLTETIEKRKAAFEESDKRTPPEFFVRDKGRYYRHENDADRRRSNTDGNSGTLRGVGVSGGSVKGRVRVILDPVKDNRLEPGDILVTKTTDPGWTRFS